MSFPPRISCSIPTHLLSVSPFISLPQHLHPCLYSLLFLNSPRKYLYVSSTYFSKKDWLCYLSFKQYFTTFLLCVPQQHLEESDKHKHTAYEWQLLSFGYLLFNNIRHCFKLRVILQIEKMHWFLNWQWPFKWFQLSFQDSKKSDKVLWVWGMLSGDMTVISFEETAQIKSVDEVEHIFFVSA